MPNYRKTMLTLPAEVVETFDGDLTTEERDAYMVRLRQAHWTLQSISEAAGVTRERVRQIVERDQHLPTTAALTFPVPTPPEKAQKAPKVYVEPDPEKLARLLELQPFAQKVRGKSPQYREEAEEYSRIVADVHLNDHVPLYRLAKRLGVTHSALRFRLTRYGYKEPQTGSSKVYTPILEENRSNA